MGDQIMFSDLSDLELTETILALRFMASSKFPNLPSLPGAGTLVCFQPKGDGWGMTGVVSCRLSLESSVLSLKWWTWDWVCGVLSGSGFHPSPLGTGTERLHYLELAEEWNEWLFPPAFHNVMFSVLCWNLASDLSLGFHSSCDGDLERKLVLNTKASHSATVLLRLLLCFSWLRSFVFSWHEMSNQCPCFSWEYFLCCYEEKPHLTFYHPEI